MSAKDIKPHVRGELLLSKELLSRSEYRAQPGNDERVAHDIFIADDAAEMALGAICSQLGYPGCKHRVSVTDYFNWLLRSGKARLPIPGMEFFTGLHKARIDLQTHFIVPDLYKWHRVMGTTLGFITAGARNTSTFKSGTCNGTWPGIVPRKLTTQPMNQLLTPLPTRRKKLTPRIWRMMRKTVASALDMTVQAAPRFTSPIQAV
jgi:hypothetical protein